MTKVKEREQGRKQNKNKTAHKVKSVYDNPNKELK